MTATNFVVSCERLLCFQATQNSALSTSLVGGKIVLMHVSNGQRTVLQSNDTYSDGMWHYITVSKQGRQLVSTLYYPHCK